MQAECGSERSPKIDGESNNTSIFIACVTRLFVFAWSGRLRHHQSQPGRSEIFLTREKLRRFCILTMQAISSHLRKLHSFCHQHGGIYPQFVEKCQHLTSVSISISLVCNLSLPLRDLGTTVDAEFFPMIRSNVLWGEPS